jgi:hypothetical protein
MRQASVGIISDFALEQCGQVMMDSKIMLRSERMQDRPRHWASASGLIASTLYGPLPRICNVRANLSYVCFCLDPNHFRSQRHLAFHHRSTSGRFIIFRRMLHKP